MFVVRRDEYECPVPLVEGGHTVFLKIVIPSRNATKQYLGEESEPFATLPGSAPLGWSMTAARQSILSTTSMNWAHHRPACSDSALCIMRASEEFKRRCHSRASQESERVNQHSADLLFLILWVAA
jgi:hypothetical protein